MKIAVVILNWNGRALLEQFLPSVISNSSGADIYVIDNASVDDSIAYLNHHHPEIGLVQLDENLGYAGGYNHGLKNIEADVYCLLNNDVKVEAGWLIPVLEAFIENQNLGAAQPTLRDYNNPDNFEYAGAAGGYIDRYGFPFCRGRIFETVEKDTGQYNDDHEIFWASGACLFVRKSLFDQLGGFDESFFAHMEEIDLCWRIHNAGFRVNHVPGSMVYHLGGGTLSHSSPRKTFLNFRNSLFMLQKNLPENKRNAIIFTRLLLDGLAALKFLLELSIGHSVAVFRAHMEFHKKKNTLSRDVSNGNNTLNYYYTRSVVWSYFFRRKRVFSRL